MARRAGVGLLAVALAAAGAGSARAGEGTRKAEGGTRTVRVTRGGSGHLGVGLEDVSSDDVKRLGLGAEEGALVRHVAEGSPAAQAGIKADDVIVSFSGEKVRSAAHLSRLIRETPAGRAVALTVLRAGARQDLHATLDASRPTRLADLSDMRMEGFDKLKALGLDKLRLDGLDALEGLELPEPPEPPLAPEPPEAPEAPAPPRPPRAPAMDGLSMFPSRPRLGIEVIDLTEQLARYMKVDDGVLISSVNAGSPAEKAGLRAGDVIVKVDGEPVRQSRDVVRHVARVDAREVTLGIQRDGHPLDVKVQLEPRARRRLPGPTT